MFRNRQSTETAASSNSSRPLPEQWREAYERDRAGEGFLADPEPERQAARALAAFILTGLGFLTLPGTLLGVWNLFEISSHRATLGASTAWIQAHGQAQLLGWVGTFILGISLYLLPKFQHRTLKTFGVVWTVWALWTLGVAWRWWAGVSLEGWRVGLVASSLLELTAYLLALWVVVLPGRQKTGQAPRKLPRDFGSWVSAAGFAVFGMALVVNIGISVSLMRTGGLPIYPAVGDRIFLGLALWGFAIPVAWGYSSRFVTVFLGLEQPDHRGAVWVCLGVCALSICALAQWFEAADWLALVTTVLAIRALKIFRRSPRPAKLAAVYGGYPAFIRLSSAWLLTGGILGIAADVWPKQAGLAGAGRHAVTVGFLATLIFALGPRILSAFLGGRELLSTSLMAASLWLLSLGCLVRVISEVVVYFAGGAAWSLLPVSAMLELAAVLLFASNLGLSARARMPAWLSPLDVDARLPLYWYVTSFPETRGILIEAGLKTLGEVKKPPRTLTLAEAAAADRADLERIIPSLRDFFSRRQPRHRGNDAAPPSAPAV